MGLIPGNFASPRILVDHILSKNSKFFPTCPHFLISTWSKQLVMNPVFFEDISVVKYCSNCGVHMYFAGDECPGCSEPLIVEFHTRRKNRLPVYLVRKGGRYRHGFKYCCSCRLHIWLEGGLQRCPFCKKLVRNGPRGKHNGDGKPRVDISTLEEEEYGSMF